MAAVGMIGTTGSSSSSSSSSSWLRQSRNMKKKRVAANRVRVSCSASSVMDPYKTLRIQPGASESEVKKAFRQLALQVFCIL